MEEMNGSSPRPHYPLDFFKLPAEIPAYRIGSDEQVLGLLCLKRYRWFSFIALCSPGAMMMDSDSWLF